MRLYIWFILHNNNKNVNFKCNPYEKITHFNRSLQSRLNLIEICRARALFIELGIALLSDAILFLEKIEVDFSSQNLLRKALENQKSFILIKKTD